MRLALLCCFFVFYFTIAPAFGADEGVDLLDRVAQENGQVYAKAVTTGTKKGAAKGNYLVEPIKDKDGKVTHVNIWSEDVLVDVMPPDSFDRDRKMRTYRGEDGKVGVAIYGDKALNKMRANGYILDAPRDANIVKVVRDGEDTRIVWQDKQGKYFSSLVKRLPNRPSVPKDSEKNLKAEPVDKDLAERLGLPAPNDNPTAATNDNDPNGNDNVAASNGDDPLADDLGIGSDDDTGADDKTGQNVAVVPSGPGPPDYGIEPIKEPGNPYGVDNILSAEEVKAAAEAAMAENRSKVKDGLSLDEYGVGIGGKAGMTHSGGIDGCIDATHALLKFYPNVKSHVEKIANEKRAKLEKERADKIAQAAASYDAGIKQGNTGGGGYSDPGPTATSTDRQNGSTPQKPPEPPKPPEMPAPPQAPSGDDIGVSSTSNGRPDDDELE